MKNPLFFLLALHLFSPRLHAIAIENPSNDNNSYKIVWGNGEWDDPCRSGRKMKTPEKQKATFGTRCGHKFILLREDLLDAKDALSRDFIEHHERFHAENQFNGGQLINFSVLNAPDSPEIRSEKLMFFKEIVKLFNEDNKSQNIPSLIISSLNKLSQLTRNSVFFSIYFEWPAEYSAYKEVFHNKANGFNSYLNLRHYLGDFDTYASGVLVGNLISEKESMIVAKNKLTGLAMLDALENMCGCTYKKAEGIEVRLIEATLPIED